MIVRGLVFVFLVLQGTFVSGLRMHSSELHELGIQNTHEFAFLIPIIADVLSWIGLDAAGAAVAQGAVAAAQGATAAAQGATAVAQGATAGQSALTAQSLVAAVKQGALIGGIAGGVGYGVTQGDDVIRTVRNFLNKPDLQIKHCNQFQQRCNLSANGTDPDDRATQLRTCSSVFLKCLDKVEKKSS